MIGNSGKYQITKQQADLAVGESAVPGLVREFKFEIQPHMTHKIAVLGTDGHS